MNNNTSEFNSVMQYRYPAILPGIRHLAGVAEPNMHVSGLDQPIHNFDPTDDNIHRILEVDDSGSGPVGFSNCGPVETPAERKFAPIIVVRRREHFGMPASMTSDVLFKIIVILFILAIAYYVITRN